MGRLGQELRRTFCRGLTSETFNSLILSEPSTNSTMTSPLAHFEPLFTNIPSLPCLLLFRTPSSSRCTFCLPISHVSSRLSPSFSFRCRCHPLTSVPVSSTHTLRRVPVSSADTLECIVRTCHRLCSRSCCRGVGCASECVAECWGWRRGGFEGEKQEREGDGCRSALGSGWFHAWVTRPHDSRQPSSSFGMHKNDIRGKTRYIDPALR